jgi:hypothetical protein
MLKPRIIAVVFGLVAITAAGQDIKKDYDHDFDFSQLHTFSVEIGTPWGNQLAENRAKEIVTNALTQKGWTPADKSTADAQVIIHGATGTKKSLNTFYSGGYAGYGWGGFGAPGTATTTVNEYRVGTMVVYVFSAKDKRLVFRGSAQDEISDKPEKNTKKVEKAVDKMFKDFPPGAKKEGKEGTM